MRFEIREVESCHPWCPHGFAVRNADTGIEWSQLFPTVEAARGTIIIRSYIGKPRGTRAKYQQRKSAQREAAIP